MPRSHILPGNVEPGERSGSQLTAASGLECFSETPCLLTELSEVGASHHPVGATATGGPIPSKGSLKTDKGRVNKKMAVGERAAGKPCLLTALGRHRVEGGWRL